jgi:DNA primase
VDKLASFPVPIPSETIEQIAGGNDIVDIIGSYFPLKRAGANFKALCPFHQEKTPSFMVNPSRQTFHCFGCGAGGSVFRFVMEYEHVDFPAAVRKLAARAGITIVEERGAADEDRHYEARRKLLKLHAEAAEWFHENLTKREIGEPARKYLKQRGITSEIAKRWQLGYAADEWDAFGSWARGQGYDARELVASGLIKTKDDDQTTNLNLRTSYDRFRGRIMFSICNREGEVIAFSGRLLKEQEGAPKYLNSPETPLFQKANVLFGFHKSKRALIEASSAIVCEGQLDLISLFEAGIMNVVAPQGTAFTDTQANLLKRYVSEVVLCFDADAAGRKAAERSLDALLQNDFIVRVVEMPPGDDPDSLVRREGKDAFERRVTDARDFFDYWIDRETAAIEQQSYPSRLRLARLLTEMIGRVPDPLLRGQITGKVASRLNLPKEELDRLLPAISTRKVELPVANRIPLQVPQVIEQLCRLALRDSEFRDFLLSQNWRPVVAELEFGRLLGHILETDFDPVDARSIEHLLNSADPVDRPFFSHCLVERRGPTNERNVGKGWWNALRADIIRREVRAAQTRLSESNLSTGEEINLQKQILDLQEQLHEFPRLVGGGDA